MCALTLCRVQREFHDEQVCMCVSVCKCMCEREIKYLTEEDYQKQSLVVQKSSASCLANCTPLVTLSVKRWQTSKTYKQ